MERRNKGCGLGLSNITTSIGQWSQLEDEKHRLMFESLRMELGVTPGRASISPEEACFSTEEYIRPGGGDEWRGDSMRAEVNSRKGRDDYR
ncbi:hypothetical protein Bca52824_022509 [Brassica carinata]|uniref:Uncharacterized protein n=1 Tax=Brassica carinata TaxID=52824 RepID=A0A8X7VGS3_BRACI|nr:hypothetical protein Bca52824_022509 [Brassica carinata]